MRHFHRLFVRQFGLPPSVLARRPVFEPVGAVAGAPTAAQMDRFRQWAGTGRDASSTPRDAIRA